MMESTEFKPGDVVCLKSSPEVRMTVSTIQDSRIQCVWMSSNNCFLQSDTFLPVVLNKWTHPVDTAIEKGITELTTGRQQIRKKGKASIVSTKGLDGRITFSSKKVGEPAPIVSPPPTATLVPGHNCPPDIK